MDYKSMMGYGKKKTLTKKQSKPKKNRILEGIKKDLNEWHHQTPTEKRWTKSNFDTGLTEFEERGGKDFIKEVGASPEYMPHIHKIYKAYHEYWDRVKDFADLLHKKGLKKQGKQFHRMYMNMVAKYHKWFVKNIRKLF